VDSRELQGGKQRMSLIDYARNDSDDFVTEIVTTDEQTSEIYGHLPYRILSVRLDDGTVTNDGTDVESISVEVVDGLEMARGTDLSDATTLDEDATATVTVDGVDQTVELTNGSGSIDITTSKPAGSTISVEAVGLESYPAESDSVEIEVISA